MSTPHPGCFRAKSAESLENKGVEFFVVPKSAQEHEKKGDSCEWRCALDQVRPLVGLEGIHPHSMYEIEKKRVAKWPSQKHMKGKGNGRSDVSSRMGTEVREIRP
jgi:hypothetical protein